MSWHATQCSLFIIRFRYFTKILWKNNFQDESYLEDDIYKQQKNEWMDVAAGNCLNIKIITGALFNMIIWKILVIMNAVMDAELTKHFIQHVQSKTGWTNLVFDIQTRLTNALIIIT
jgi:hypothetical protein